MRRNELVQLPGAILPSPGGSNPEDGALAEEDVISASGDSLSMQDVESGSDVPPIVRRQSSSHRRAFVTMESARFIRRAADEVRGGLARAREDLEHLREDLAPPDLAALRQNVEARSHELQRDMVRVRQILTSERTKHDATLFHVWSQVALLVEMPRQGPPVLCPALEVLHEAEVTFYGEPRRLLILQLAQDAGVRMISPAKQILEIAAAARGCADLAGAVVVPLHQPEVTEAIMAMEAEELTRRSAAPWWRRTAEQLLRALRITSPTRQRVDAFENHYGPGVEFMFAWSAFFIQQLWILVPYSLLWECFESSELRKGQLRWVWEVKKAAIVLWAAWLAWRTTRLHLHPSERRRSRVRCDDLVRDEWRSSEPCGDRLKRLAALALFGVPLLALLLLLAALALSGVTLLILRLVYVWGSCLELHSKDSVCRDAEVKYGIIGWAAEVACDIILAILFELLFSVGAGLTDWVADRLNFKHTSDPALFKEMLNLSLAALERIGFVGSLAFLFAPQWVAPVCVGPEIDRLDLFCDCGDLAFGASDYRCFQRRLPVETRRWLFESLMKGPFIVAPFVSIVIKVLVPQVAWQLSRVLDASARCRCCCCMAPVRAILRFLVLVFTYEGGNVKCFTYVRRGQPFGELPPEAPGRARLAAALHQLKLKAFGVPDELLELEMSLLWVAFFTPVLPRGIFFTLVAKLVEVNTDLTKMLFVRSRGMPMDDQVLRREVIAFAWAVVVASVGWSAGLSLITYNDALWQWGWKGVGLFLGMCAWICFASLATVCAVNHFTGRRRAEPARPTESGES